jgi:hypothetical protein
LIAVLAWIVFLLLGVIVIGLLVAFSYPDGGFHPFDVAYHPGATTILWIIYVLLGLAITNVAVAPWMLVAPVLAVEPVAGLRSALARSRALVRGARWRIAVGVLAVSAIAGILPFAGSILLWAAMWPYPSPGDLAGGSPNVLASALIPQSYVVVCGLLLWPIGAIGLTRLYNERVSQVGQ